MSIIFTIQELIEEMIDGSQSTSLKLTLRKFISRKHQLITKKKKSSRLLALRERSNISSMMRIMECLKRMFKYLLTKQKLRLLSRYSLESIGLKLGTLLPCLKSTIKSVYIFATFAYFFVFIKKNFKGILKNAIRGILQGTRYIEMEMFHFLKLMDLHKKYIVKI